MPGDPDDGEFVATESVDSPGDEWEEIDVSDTDADRIARERDREFAEFKERIKDADQFKVEASVFDDATFAALYKLVQDGLVAAFGGPIATGKEANVYTALAGERARDELEKTDDQDDLVATDDDQDDLVATDDDQDEVEVAVKVYRITASDFQDMRDYLDGDPRFSGIGNDKGAVVQAWVRKELGNLERAARAGVRVPRPLAVQRNVLVMEYIGQEERAKRLAEVHVENPETAFDVVREYVKRLYAAGLVHGDLSEYNLVIHEGELVVIDLGQAVTVHHPNADEFLERDCANLATFFSDLGVDVTTDSLYEAVVSVDEE